jgi:cysteine desulfurase family protein (TIGR01976 family)
MTTTAQTAPDVQFASVESIRAHFPALTRRHAGKPVAYFDGPGGTQVPREVVDAMADYLCNHNANTHWAYPTSVETDAAINHSREVFSDFFNCTPREVAFGNNMTTITFHISRALGRKWGPGDEIVVTELDHQANVSPWRALAKERGLTIRSVPFDPQTGELVWAELERAVTSKTRLVAIGAASNALGTISPIRKAAELAHSKGALCYVDAVHFAAHCVIDLKEMGCDFLACSPYKFYGPHAGVLFARAEVMSALDVPKVEPASNEIPERVETGTQNHEGIVGAGAAVEFLASVASGLHEPLTPTLSPSHGEREKNSGFRSREFNAGNPSGLPLPKGEGRGEGKGIAQQPIVQTATKLSVHQNTRREHLVRTMSGLHARGEVLFERLWSGLTGIKGVRCYGPPPGRPRTPTVSFTVAGVSSTDVARGLVSDGVFVSNGNFYATTVMERLGHAQTGVVRAGCACYTSDEEIERLVDGIRRIAAGKNVVG